MPSRDTTCPECQEHHGYVTGRCPYEDPAYYEYDDEYRREDYDR